MLIIDKYVDGCLFLSHLKIRVMSFFKKLLDHPNSVLKILIFTAIFIFIIALMLSSHFREKMALRWRKHRCNPFLLPVSGFFRQPDDPRGYFEFTVDNTKKCTESILKRFFHAFTEPLREIFKIISNIIKDLVDVLNRFRFHHSITKKLFKEIVGNIAAKISNTYAALQFYQSKLLTLINQQKSLLSIMMMFTKAVGITMESLINGPLTALVHFLEVFLIGLLVLTGICVISSYNVPCGWPQAYKLWMFPFPFTWMGRRLLMGTKPVGDNVCVPFPELIPNPMFWFTYLPCTICFHPDTPIKCTKYRSCPIKHLQVGQYIFGGEEIISVMKIYVGKNATGLYNYCGIQVTGSHMILEIGEHPIRVQDHPYAKPIYHYDSDWVYCLNTKRACVWSGCHQFADYWETTCPITNLKTQCLIEDAVNDFEKDRQIKTTPFTDYQTQLDRIINPHLYQVGLHRNTYLKMANSTFKQIKDITIGDRVLHGGLVTGVIVHDTRHLKMYQLGYLIASGTQLIYHRGQWIRLFQHPDAKLCVFEEEKESYHIMTEASQLETIHGDKLRDYFEIQTNHPVFDKIHQLNLYSRTSPRISWKSTIQV